MASDISKNGSLLLFKVKIQRLTLNPDYFYFLSHYSVFYSVCVADWPLISLKSVHSLGKRRTAGQVKISVVSVDNYWDVVGRMNRSWMQILFSDFTFLACHSMNDLTHQVNTQCVRVITRSYEKKCAKIKKLNSFEPPIYNYCRFWSSEKTTKRHKSTW